MNGFCKITRERAMSISLDEYIEECQLLKKSFGCNDESQDDYLSSKDDESSAFIKIWDNNNLEQIVRNTKQKKINNNETNEPWITKKSSQQWRLHRYKARNRPNDMPPLVVNNQQNFTNNKYKNRKKSNRFPKNNVSLKEFFANTQIWRSDPFTPNNINDNICSNNQSTFTDTTYASSSAAAPSETAINNSMIACQNCQPDPNIFQVNGVLNHQNTVSEWSHDLINENQSWKQISKRPDIAIDNNNIRNSCAHGVTAITNIILKEVENRVANNDNKNKYDINIQKQISAFQNKPYAYKCPGGGVICQDGVGINDCIVVPKQTGVSMNQRFA